MRPAGPPFAIYHDPEFREDDVDVEIAVPVSEPVADAGRVVGGTLPGGEVAFTLHAGPYDELGPAYRALTGWVEEHGRETVGPPREAYLVGPDTATEPSQLRTEAAWPIR